MALIKCPECGRNVSDTAKACPGCGYGILAYLDRAMPKRDKFQLKVAKYSSWDSFLELHEYERVTFVIPNGKLVCSEDSVLGVACMYRISSPTVVNVQVEGPLKYVGPTSITLTPGSVYEFYVEMRQSEPCGFFRRVRTYPVFNLRMGSWDENAYTRY